MATKAKTVDEHKRDGTLRKKHANLKRGKAEEAPDFSPPDTVPKKNHRRWSYTVSDLRNLGPVTRADLVLLESAFIQLGNAQALQSAFTEALTNPEASSSDITKLQGGTASANAMFLRLVGEVKRSVRMNPVPEENDDWLSRTTT